jgi:ABC-type Fe3+/spermidine/putrescine transport system ATPase subunit
MMFQHYAIFPHMTVAQNVAYGLKVRGMGAAERDARVEEMLALVGLAGMGAKNATLLSGGESQRVALARALAPRPRMLLLDEPLSALDERIRRAMQAELKRVHAETGTTFLYVTHDQEEALTMSDRIAVFNRGHCVQCDEPEALYRRPRTTFVARFFRDCNVLSVTDLIRTKAALPPGVAHVAVRAEEVHIGAGTAAVQLDAVLKEVTYRGTVLDYELRLADGQTLTATMTRRLGLAPSAQVTVGIAPEHFIALDD